ncbi:MAG: DUF262 domain-containing protein [Bacteroidota bacterium]
MSKVNLDALIRRDDFISTGSTQNKPAKLPNITLGHLLPKSESNYISIYDLLRKPDFQRETNEWDKKRIADLIESFMELAFIPSIILWENEDSGHFYVIDGAHRLSAVIAYINDDYGDRKISHDFYGFNKIPQAEIELAEETRTYINNRVGAFADVMREGGDRSNGLKKAAFDLQMITGNVKKAEDSFFAINQQGVVLSPTEKQLCKNRDKPISIATRAIIKGGAGTQYWKKFEANNQATIKEISEQSNHILFKPPYSVESQSTILHHPLGGTITNATPMIFDFMKIIKNTYFPSKKEMDDLVKGDDTLEYLAWTRKILWKILSNEAGSLGLFPSVYFYNSGGKYIQSALLGMVQLLLENEKNDETFLPKFTKVRHGLETFLLNNKVLLTQINRKYGSKERSYRHMKGFFNNLVELFDKDLSEAEVLKSLKNQETYNFLNELESDTEAPKSKRFSKEQKIAISNREELDGMPKCKICNGLLHPFSKSYDHKKDLKKGGGSETENAQSTHHYCNNSKDKLIQLGIYVEPQLDSL